MQELSQLWGEDIFAKNYVYEKLTEYPNFTWYLPEKYFFSGVLPPRFLRLCVIAQAKLSCHNVVYFLFMYIFSLQQSAGAIRRLAGDLSVIGLLQLAVVFVLTGLMCTDICCVLVWVCSSDHRTNCTASTNSNFTARQTQLIWVKLIALLVTTVDAGRQADIRNVIYLWSLFLLGSIMVTQVCWLVASAVRIVFFFSFRIESNSYRWSQKSPVVSTCEINLTVFMAPPYCGFCCRSFSTWWAIMGQYKDFKEIQDLDHC